MAPPVSSAPASCNALPYSCLSCWKPVAAPLRNRRPRDGSLMDWRNTLYSSGVSGVQSPWGKPLPGERSNCSEASAEDASSASKIWPCTYIWLRLGLNPMSGGASISGIVNWLCLTSSRPVIAMSAADGPKPPAPMLEVGENGAYGLGCSPTFTFDKNGFAKESPAFAMDYLT